MSILPPGGARPTQGMAPTETKKDNPVTDSASKQLSKLSEERPDSMLLKSKHFRQLAGDSTFFESVKYNLGNALSNAWEKVKSLASVFPAFSKGEELTRRDDIRYRDAVSEVSDRLDDAVESLKNAAKEAETLEKKTDTPSASAVYTPPARDVAKEAKKYADSLQKSKEQSLDPKIDRAYKLADETEKDALFEANLDLNRAFTDIDENPNDDGVENLTRAYSKVSQMADRIVNKEMQNRGQIVSSFKIVSGTLLLDKLEEPSYKTSKEQKWGVYAQARNQLNAEVKKNENELAKYQRGEIDDFNGAQRLTDLKALITKYNDAVNSYNQD